MNADEDDLSNGLGLTRGILVFPRNELGFRRSRRLRRPHHQGITRRGKSQDPGGPDVRFACCGLWLMRAASLLLLASKICASWVVAFSERRCERCTKRVDWQGEAGLEKGRLG